MATGSDGCVGLGHSARLKGTWVGLAVGLMGKKGMELRVGVQRVRVEIHT